MKQEERVWEANSSLTSHPGSPCVMYAGGGSQAVHHSSCKYYIPFSKNTFLDKYTFLHQKFIVFCCLFEIFRH